MEAKIEPTSSPRAFQDPLGARRGRVLQSSPEYLHYMNNENGVASMFRSMRRLPGGALEILHLNNANAYSLS